MTKREGAANPNSKLTYDQVLDIKRLLVANCGPTEIARTIGPPCQPYDVDSIRREATWASVPWPDDTQVEVLGRWCRWCQTRDCQTHQDTTDRNSVIRDLHEQHVPLEDIAAQFGLSTNTVYKIAKNKQYGKRTRAKHSWFA